MAYLYLVIILELFDKIVPVLFAVVYTIKSCLPNVCLDPFVLLDRRNVNCE